MFFPFDDQYWIDAENFAKKHLKEGDTILCPKEFEERFPYIIHSYDSILPKNMNFTWAIIHKGMIDEINYSMLKSITKKLPVVFANEVFVVFSSHPELQRINADSPHFQSFQKEMQCRSGIINSLKRGINSLKQRSKPLTTEKAQVDQAVQADVAMKTVQAEMETFCRGKYQTAYLGKGVVLCRVLGRYLLYADAEDVGIVPHLCLDGFWESWVTLAMARVLESGWRCIDVGANHGYYSLLMAGAVGASGRVLAIEPNPRLVMLLERTLGVNGFQPHAMAIQKAVSDANGTRTNLVIPGGRGLNATIYRHPTEMDVVFEVETTTIDELTKDWPCVNLVKVDAEGAEQAIFCGMQETLRQHQSIVVIMEVNCSRYADPRAFLQAIQDAGFPLRHIDFDSEIKDLTVEQCLTERPEEDWMLFLQRGSLPTHSMRGRAYSF